MERNGPSGLPEKLDHLDQYRAVQAVVPPELARVAVERAVVGNVGDRAVVEDPLPLAEARQDAFGQEVGCLLYTSPSPRDS